ncbi:hypothetical protein FB45DRAFT_865608 [Roridomyces roridus]|uniref:Uncharacterized protein n=1 Tax=Roridomyces roridus TaxID=1738132 RepID=A0AAD7BZT3_9AGAR|nr:hypothetical protein FB45DRAFT_865608 [Roridomyces roridus]
MAPAPSHHWSNGSQSRTEAFFATERISTRDACSPLRQSPSSNLVPPRRGLDWRRWSRLEPIFRDNARMVGHYGRWESYLCLFLGFQYERNGLHSVGADRDFTVGPRSVRRSFFFSDSDLSKQASRSPWNNDPAKAGSPFNPLSVQTAAASAHRYFCVESSDSGGIDNPLALNHIGGSQRFLNATSCGSQTEANEALANSGITADVGIPFRLALSLSSDLTSSTAEFIPPSSSAVISEFPIFHVTPQLTISDKIFSAVAEQRRNPRQLARCRWDLDGLGMEKYYVELSNRLWRTETERNIPTATWKEERKLVRILLSQFRGKSANTRRVGSEPPQKAKRSLVGPLGVRVTARKLLYPLYTGGWIPGPAAKIILQRNSNNGISFRDLRQAGSDRLLASGTSGNWAGSTQRENQRRDGSAAATSTDYGDFKLA